MLCPAVAGAYNTAVYGVGASQPRQIASRGYSVPQMAREPVANDVVAREPMAQMGSRPLTASEIRGEKKVLRRSRTMRYGGYESISKATYPVYAGTKGKTLKQPMSYGGTTTTMPTMGGMGKSNGSSEMTVMPSMPTLAQSQSIGSNWGGNNDVANLISLGGVRRRVGPPNWDDAFEEFLNGLTDEQLAMVLAYYGGENNEYKYYNLQKLIELIQSLIDSGSNQIPDDFGDDWEDSVEGFLTDGLNNGWVHRLPLGDGIWGMIVMAAIYVLWLTQKSKNKA